MSEREINSEASSHLEDLKRLKDVDSAFYKYLEEHGSDLLNPEGFCDEENIQTESDELVNLEFGIPKLTKEKFYAIKENIEVTDSFKDFSLLLSCFRSVTNINTLENEVIPNKPSPEKNKKRKLQCNQHDSKPAKKERVALFQIEDSDLMLEIIQYVLENISNLFWLHSSGEKKSRHLSYEISLEDLPKSSKVEKLSREFWEDVGNLILNNCLSLNPNLELMEFVFNKLSNPLLLGWLLLNRLATDKFTILLTRVWTMNKYALIRQGAFTVLKEINSYLGRMSKKSTQNGDTVFELKEKNSILNHPIKRHEGFLLILHRTIGLSAIRGISWKNYFSSKQVISDYLSLLKDSDHQLVYRIAFNIIRKLGSILRILFLRISRMPNSESGAKKESNNFIKHKRLFDEVYSNIFSWKFIVFVRIWSRAISEIKELYPLQYPLVTIITSTVKIKLNSIHFLPFTLQCLEVLTEMGHSNKTFIPVMEMLIEAHSTIEKGTKQSFQNPSQSNAKNQNLISASSKPFVPEFEIKIGNSVFKSSQVYDSLSEFWVYILVQYTFSMAKHPSFPEFILGISPNIKKLQKQNSKYWNDHVIQEVKDLIKKSEQHSENIKKLRFTTSTNKVFINSVLNSKSERKFNSPFSSSFYTENIFDSIEQTKSSINIDEFVDFIEKKKAKREELIKGKIKLSSLKAENQEGTGNFASQDQDDLEFKLLLRQLQNVGKTIDDLRRLGPRQLKKLKKSIKKQALNSTNVRYNELSTSPIAIAIDKKYVAIREKAENYSETCIEKNGTKTFEKKSESSKTPYICKKFKLETNHSNSRDKIEDWDIYSEDEN
ncbi:Noc2p family protein [Cryptosporidium felis]|nr:Noc2p family protein [Cryptosporidium felis]